MRGQACGARGRALGAAVIALGGFACGIDTAPPPPPAGDPTFSAIHGDTLAGACALGSCHGGAAPAARLDFHLVSADDIVKICYALVERPSCLFAGRPLVVPFKPEASFLIDKLRGTALAGDPEPACAGTNRRMPFGLPPLGENQIKQIEDWISAGASCAGPRPIDAAVEPPVDTSPAVPGDIAALTAAATAIAPGQRTQITVALTRPAPGDGQTVGITTADDTVLGVPSAVRIERDRTEATFDVLGKRPALATAITAAAGAVAKSLDITVTEADAGARSAARSRATTRADQATPAPGGSPPASLQPGNGRVIACDR